MMACRASQAGNLRQCPGCPPRRAHDSRCKSQASGRQERSYRGDRRRAVDRLGLRQDFRALGAERSPISTTKPRNYVEPLARELETPIFMPLDVRTSGQMEAVFDQAANSF